MLSVIIPSYNEEQMIKICSDKISDILINEEILFELIFVDDGSKDKTIEVIKNLSEKDKRVKYIRIKYLGSKH